jgi:hypothetical protein
MIMGVIKPDKFSCLGYSETDNEKRFVVKVVRDSKPGTLHNTHLFNSYVRYRKNRRSR